MRFLSTRSYHTFLAPRVLVRYNCTIPMEFPRYEWLYYFPDKGKRDELCVGKFKKLAKWARITTVQQSTTLFSGYFLVQL